MACHVGGMRITIVPSVRSKGYVEMFEGSFVALVTPMHDDGRIDDRALADLVEFHVGQGTAGIVAVGTTGESATLDHAEHIRVIGRVVELVRGRIAVIGGTGSNSTREAIELTRAAKEVGVDGCLLVTPYYNKPTQEGLFLHYLTIANAVDVPQILYNVPGRTACDLLPETVARLATHACIVGIKEASGDVERIMALREATQDGITILSGEDACACEAMLRGARGVISVTANVVPALMRDMVDAAVAGDRGTAETIDIPMQELHRALFFEANPIPVKWALHEMGRIESGIRLPLTPLAAQYRKPLRNAMTAAGVRL